MRVAIGGGVIDGIPVAGLTGATDRGAPVYLSTSNLAADATLTPATNLPAIGYIEDVNGAGTLARVRLYASTDLPQA